MPPSPDRSAALGVYLEPDPQHATRVGTLVRDAAGNVVFVVDENYIQLGPTRPILSARWHYPEDGKKTSAALLDRSDKIAHGGFLPKWFAGLLPEGALRDLVERQLGTGRHDDFDVIAHLGHDLPGAVVVRGDSRAEALFEAGITASDRHPAHEPPRIRFSLAGIQLKFSMRMAQDKLTVPARNEFGDVIAKLPNERFPGLPEAEFSTMKLAEAAGVQIAEVQLVPTGEVEGLPEKWISYGEYLLAVRRFDREGGRRVHVEDFAQVLGAVDDRKYTMSNEETNMRLVRRFCQDPTGAVLEAVRRIVVNVLVGNHDAHLKNWSLLYKDPAHPILAPAYDIVPVVAYIPDDRLALEFQGTRNPAAITYRKFERPAQYVDMDPRAMVREARRTVERAADLWPSLIKDLPIRPTHVAALRERWKTLALTKEIENGFRDTLEAKS